MMRFLPLMIGLLLGDGAVKIAVGDSAPEAAVKFIGDDNETVGEGNNVTLGPTASFYGASPDSALDANDVASFSLTGWYPDCTAAQEDVRCIGGLVSSADPKPLDPTGATCYVNPYHMVQQNDAVFWYSPVSAYANTTSADVVYTHFVVMSLNDAIIPTNCTDDGVCDCGLFEQVRSGWDEPRSDPLDALEWCKFPAVSCGVSQASLVVGECSVNARLTIKDETGVVISNNCFLLGTVDKLSEPTPAPTGDSTSGGVKHALPSFWAVLILFSGPIIMILK